MLFKCIHTVEPGSDPSLQMVNLHKSADCHHLQELWPKWHTCIKVTDVLCCVIYHFYPPLSAASLTVHAQAIGPMCYARNMGVTFSHMYSCGTSCALYLHMLGISACDVDTWRVTGTHDMRGVRFAGAVWLDILVDQHYDSCNCSCWTSALQSTPNKFPLPSRPIT